MTASTTWSRSPDRPRRSPSSMRKRQTNWSSTAAEAMIRSMPPGSPPPRSLSRLTAAPATICSSGIRAMAATRSRGQDGVDALLFNGANVNENIDISANGERVRFFRDVANVTMDLNDVEGIVFNALGGADNITINDVSGTDLALSGIAIDLAGTAGGGDGAVDTVTVNGRATDDTIDISTVDGLTWVTGSPTAVVIFNAEATDQLIVNGASGVDTID